MTLIERLDRILERTAFGALLSTALLFRDTCSGGGAVLTDGGDDTGIVSDASGDAPSDITIPTNDGGADVTEIPFADAGADTNTPTIDAAQ